MERRRIKIIIVASLDGSANEERAKNVMAKLRNVGFQVSFFDAVKHFSQMTRVKYFFISPNIFINYAGGLFKHKLKLRKQYPLVEEMFLRGDIIRKYLKDERVKIVICQNPQDMTCLLQKSKGLLTIYDTPIIYSEEIKNLNIYSQKVVKTITEIEGNVFETADGVAFQWEIYFKLAKLLDKKITNPFIANWGCVKQSKYSRFSKKPKMIYLGKLNTGWVNPKLLVDIQKTSLVPVDIFSYETPDERYQALKFSGFLDNLEKVSDYQFGLITISNDQLRKYGFSAKHLLYISFGLPVLCPEWRKDNTLEQATIYYNKQNFNNIVKQYGQKKEWEKKHRAAIQLARKFDWNKTLKPLVKHLNSILKV